MIDTNVVAPPIINVRDQILADCDTAARTAEALGVSERTFRRWRVPAIRVGGRVWYHIPTVRAWLLSHQQDTRPQPRRGRPPSARRVAA